MCGVCVVSDQGVELISRKRIRKLGLLSVHDPARQGVICSSVFNVCKTQTHVPKRLASFFIGQAAMTTML